MVRLTDMLIAVDLEVKPQRKKLKYTTNLFVSYYYLWHTVNNGLVQLGLMIKSNLISG